MKIERTEIERLFRRHYARMYQLARGVLRDDEEARDAVSDVFAKLLDRDKPVEIGRSEEDVPSAERERIEERFLLVAVRNHCLNLVGRKQTAEKASKALPMETDTGRTADELEREERHLQDIRTFIDTRLTPRTRDIMRMRYDQQQSCRDISEACNISLAAVYKHITQGIERLKEKFNP